MITKELINGGTVWQITGPGLYATYKANQSTGLPYLTRLGYVQNVQFPAAQDEAVIISDSATMTAYTGIDIVADPTRELEAFIRALYVIGVEFDTSGTFDLQSDLESAGKLDKYPSALTGAVNLYQPIAVFDFMVMTGAILYPFNRLESGNLTSRPTVQAAPQGDKNTMFGVVRTLGIWGYIVNLLSEYGITEQEFTSMLTEWKPIQADRAEWFNGYAVQHLRTKGWRLLSSNEKTALIG